MATYGRWEYRQVEWLDKDKLDELLDAGWEPFAVTKSSPSGAFTEIHLKLWDPNWKRP